MDYLADVHGNVAAIIEWIQRKEDEVYLCVLGDSGLNFYEDNRDVKLKTLLQDAIEAYAKRSGIRKKILLVRGNHDLRPEKLDSYKNICTEVGGVLIEAAYPELYFLENGTLYTIEEEQYFVLGGGTSADGYQRILNNWKWCCDEELSDEEIRKYMSRFAELGCTDVTVLSHMLPKGIKDGKHVRSKTEDNLRLFFDQFKEQVKEWKSGHYHKKEVITKEGIDFEVVYWK